MRLPPDLAGRLAFYKAEYAPLALAPRGWRCSGRYGSGGGFVLVAPGQGTETDPRGPAVYAAVWIGDTSGRLAVADLRARSAPRGLPPLSKQAADDALKPFPTDVLVHKSPRIVQYTTPANTKGLGTEHGAFEPGALPIHGVVIFEGPESAPNAHVLAVRLPAGLGEAIPVIVAHAISDPSER